VKSKVGGPIQRGGAAAAPLSPRPPTPPAEVVGLPRGWSRSRSSRRPPPRRSPALPASTLRCPPPVSRKWPAILLRPLRAPRPAWAALAATSRAAQTRRWSSAVRRCLRLPVLAASAARPGRRGVGPGQPLRPGAAALPPKRCFVDPRRRGRGGRLPRGRAAGRASAPFVPSVEMGDEQGLRRPSAGTHAQHPRRGGLGRRPRARGAHPGGWGSPPAVGGRRLALHTGLDGGRGVSTPRHVRRVRPGEEAAFLAPLSTGLLPRRRRHPWPGSAPSGSTAWAPSAALSPADLGPPVSAGDAGLAVHRYGPGARTRPPVTPADRPPRALVERLVIEGGAADRELLSRLRPSTPAAILGGRLARAGPVGGVGWA